MVEDTGSLSLRDSGRIGQLEVSVEMLDKRLDRMALELRDLKLLANEAATKRDVVGVGRRIRGSLAVWCIVLAVVVWYFATGAAWLAPFIRPWTG